jgi:hypothetical protein
MSPENHTRAVPSPLQSVETLVVWRGVGAVIRDAPQFGQRALRECPRAYHV